MPSPWRVAPGVWPSTPIGSPRDSPTAIRAACELPRVYHLLKLCFVGGRLPRRPVERESVRRTGDEPFPPDCLDVLSLLEATGVDQVLLAVPREEDIPTAFTRLERVTMCNGMIG